MLKRGASKSGFKSRRPSVKATELPPGAGVNLHVMVVEVKKLAAADRGGTSDPYVNLFVAPAGTPSKEKGLIKQKTKVIKKVLSARFEDQFNFDNADRSHMLFIEVKDWNRTGKHTLLGTLEIPVATFKTGRTVEKYYKLKGDGAKGEIRLITLAETSNAFVSLAPKGAELGKDILQLSILRGRRLLAKDVTGTSDPYAIISLGTYKVTTSIIKKDLTPEWNEEFFLEIEDAKKDVLDIEIMDWDRIGKDDPMGYFSVALSDLLDGQTRENWFPLNPRKREKVGGEIQIRVRYITAKLLQKNFGIAKANFDALTKLIISPDMVLVSSLAKAFESNDLAKKYVEYFWTQGKLIDVVVHLIYREVKSETKETGLFRQNSMATKVMVQFFKRIGYSFLKTVLGMPIKKIMDDPKGYELDKNRDKKADMVANRKKLEATAQMFLDNILDSRKSCPADMLKIFATLHRIVGTKFPASSRKSVGALFFLRFFGPAISAPEGFGLLPGPPNDEQRRSLTLVGKIIQNLANGVRFGSKEKFMIPLNTFLDANFKKINDFMDSIASDIKGEGGLQSAKIIVEEQEKILSLSTIIGAIKENKKGILKRIPTDYRVVGGKVSQEDILKRMAAIEKFLA